MITRQAAVASVRLYDQEAVPTMGDHGWMSYYSFHKNLGLLEVSKGGVFSGVPGLPDLVHVPGINGLILRPYVQSEDSNMAIRKQTGDWSEYYSDNDAWGEYYEFAGTGSGSLTLCDNAVNSLGVVDVNSGAANIAVRIRKYEAFLTVNGRYSVGNTAATIIYFGGIWCVVLPYSGTCALCKKVNGAWKEVMTLKYTADMQSVTDAIDLYIMNIAGKLVISSDGLVSADIYEEAIPVQFSGSSSDTAGFVVAAQNVQVVTYGARCQVAVRKLRFVKTGYVRIKSKPRFDRSAMDLPALRDLAAAHSSVRAGTNKIPSVNYAASTNATLTVVGDYIYSAIKAEGAGWGTPVLYGFVWKVPPTVYYPSVTTYEDLTADNYSISLECPSEQENTKATVSLKTMVKATVDGRTKWVYADIGYISNYRFADVRLGFRMLNTDTGAILEPGDPGNAWQRTFFGTIKDVALTQGGGCDFTLVNASLQMQETQCDGYWGPWDGLTVIEALQNLANECGIPNVFVRGVREIGGSIDWLTVDEALADEHIYSMLTALDYGDGKEPKWKPRVGDSGLSVAQELIAYENGLLTFGDDFNLYYDPFYYNEIDIAMAEIPAPLLPGDTEPSGVYIEPVITGYNWNNDIVKNFTAIEDSPDDYAIAVPINVSLTSDRFAKTVIVAGQRYGGGSKQLISVGATNPNASKGGSMYIPFPKRLVVAIKSVDNIGTLVKILNKYTKRLFSIPREYSITTHGHADVVARHLVTYSDSNVEGSYGTSEGSAVIMVESAKHTWSASDNAAWAKTEIDGYQFAYTGGSAFEVNV